MIWLHWYDVVLSGILNVFSLYADVRFLRLFFKGEKHSYDTIIFTIVWLVNWFAYFYIESFWLTIITSVIGIFVIASFFYEGIFYKKLLASLMTFSVGFISEDIIWYMTRKMGKQIDPNLGQLTSIILIMLLVLIFERLFSLKKDGTIPFWGYINILLISLGSAYIGDIIVDSSKQNDYRSILALSIIGVMNISTFYIYENIHDAYKNQFQKAMLEQSVKMYQNQFEIIETTQKNIRSLRHDIHNHMYLIQEYIQKGEYDNATKYMKQIETAVYCAHEYVRSGNNEVDSILNYILAKAYEIKSEVDISIEVPKENFMDTFDLNIVLSNLLENAITALKKTTDRKLTIYMKYNKGILYLKVHNTYDGVIQKRGNTYLSTKDNKAEHGLGMINIKQIVDKYYGSMKINTENGEFKTDIIMYVK